MIRLRHYLACTIAAGAILGASTAFATTVKKLTLHELSLQANDIVTARVLDTESRWDAGHKEIYTYITLRVIEPVKGAKDRSTITLRQLGGVVDNIASIVPGMPAFKKNEEVVLFLTGNDAAGYPWILGLQQGKYSIVSNKDGVKMVRNDLAGTELIRAGKAEEPTVAPDQPLGSFLDGIRTSLDQPGKIEVDPTSNE